MKLKTEITPEGLQTLIPGVSPISDSKRLRSKADAPLKKTHQKPCDHGLFGDASKQVDLLDLLAQK